MTDKEIVAAILKQYSKADLRALYKRGVRRVDVPILDHDGRIIKCIYTVIELLNHEAR